MSYKKIIHFFVFFHESRAAPVLLLYEAEVMLILSFVKCKSNWIFTGKCNMQHIRFEGKRLLNCI